MGDPLKGEEPVSSLGISAAIMILYNMIGWPYLLEMTNRKKLLRDQPNDSHRAWEIVNQIDTVVDYATGIMTMVSNLADNKEGAKFDLDYEHGMHQSDINSGDAEDVILTLLDES